MRKFLAGIVSTALLAGPAQAADWRNSTTEMRPGTFVGFRLTIGGKTGGKPSAALTIAPTQNRISHDGMSSMRIGEGIALNLSSGTRPTLTLAGVRADHVLGLQRQGGTDAESKLGVSKTGWAALGIATALVAGAAVFYVVVTDCDEHDDECGY